MDEFDFSKYKPQPINYKDAEIMERVNSHNMLYIFLKIENIPSDEQKYEHLLSMLDIFGMDNKCFKDEKDFKKWYKSYRKKLRQRIIGFANKWNYSPDYIRNKIIEDEAFAYNFIEEPTRKTFHQHYAANWIKNNLLFLCDFKELINQGNEALYVENGKLMSGSELTSPPLTKSIDFTWKYKFMDRELSFYATHKYTAISGGNQDNQLEDVFLFLRQACQSNDKDKIYLSITDGEYYQGQYTKYKEKKISKLDYMKETFNTEYTISTTLNDLASEIIPIIIRWLEKWQDAIPNNDIVKELETLNKFFALYS